MVIGMLISWIRRILRSRIGLFYRTLAGIARLRQFFVILLIALFKIVPAEGCNRG